VIDPTEQYTKIRRFFMAVQIPLVQIGMPEEQIGGKDVQDNDNNCIQYDECYFEVGVYLRYGYAIDVQAQCLAIILLFGALVKYLY